MNEGIITGRYAKALFQAGEEENKTNTIYKDIQSILQSVNESEEFSEFLSSPIIKESEKVKVFANIFKGKIDLITLNFLLLLAKNKREQLLGATCLQYIKLYKEKKGLKEAILTTASKIDDSHIKDIHDYIKKKFKLDVELVKNIDATIIGGFKLRVEDRQIDASIKTKLKEIHKELINS